MVCAHNYAHNFYLVPRFWSRLHDKDCLYILSSFKNSFFPFRLAETTFSLHCDLQRQLTSFHFDFQRQHTHTLSLSLLHLTFSTQPHKNVYIPPPFSFLFYLYGWTCSSLENNHRNFVKPPKETTNHYGRRHVPPNIH